jgi:peptidoglycan/LPS O-acetylase OafA/YrhL
MTPVSPIPILVIFFLALATTHIFAKRFTIVLPIGRVSTIDGLRGYLGFSVYLHHASIWFFFLRTGKWEDPPSNLYTHLGQTAVTLFFMITGFLFFSKLMDSKTRPVDWTKLYISRFFRLTPLYLVVIGTMLLTIAVLSDWQLREPIPQLIYGIARWLAFLGGPDLNGVTQTWIITAGATWTLKYEWVFYLMLPLFALPMTARPPIGYLVLAVLAVAATVFLNLSVMPMCAFLGGIAAAVLVRFESVRVVAQMKFSALLAIACVAAVIAVFPTAYGWMPLLLLSIAFILVAGGNTLFGLLTNRASRLLGEMTYSIYLLHGLALFLVFRFVFGFSGAAKLSAVEHWTVIAICTPLLISISFCTLRLIELPAMRITPKVTNWIKSRRTKVPKPLLSAAGIPQ